MKPRPMKSHYQMPARWPSSRGKWWPLCGSWASVPLDMTGERDFVTCERCLAALAEKRDEDPKWSVRA